MTHYPQPSATPPYYPPPPPRRKRTGLIVTLSILGGLLVLCLIGVGIVATFSNGASDPQDTAATPGFTTVTTPADRGAAATTATTAVPTTPPAATTKAAPVKATIPEGDWTAGDDFPVGTYQTGATGDGCIWQTWTGDGENKHYIEPGRFGPGRFKHAFKKGETLSSQGCGSWTQV
jgi:hypothetical protein